MSRWIAIGVLVLGCYLLRLAGSVVPREWVEEGRRGQAVLLLPVALLSSLIVVATFVDEQRLVADARAAGLAAAMACLLLRAPLLVTVAVASAVTAVLRAV